MSFDSLVDDTLHQGLQIELTKRPQMLQEAMVLCTISLECSSCWAPPPCHRGPFPQGQSHNLTAPRAPASSRFCNTQNKGNALPGAIHTCTGSQKCARGSHGSSERVAGQELSSSQEALGTVWGQLLTFSAPASPLGTVVWRLQRGSCTPL